MSEHLPLGPNAPFTRTVCACPECTRNCRFIPGFLTPDDLRPLADALGHGEDIVAFSRAHLLASVGATVMTRHGELLQVRTLVPARSMESNHCHLLTADGRCRVHTRSPFGCRFFDAHLPHDECDRRSSFGLAAILDAWRRGDLYARIWLDLDARGRRAVPASEARRRMAADMNKPPNAA